jgi:tetratricopeptide (TPR) repeat protein
MLASLKEMGPVLPRYAKEVRRIKGQAALRNADVEFGHQVAQEMLLTGSADEAMDGLELKGRMLLLEGKAQAALDDLIEVKRSKPSPLLDCDIAQCYAMLGRKEEALQLVESIGRHGGIEDPDLLEEVYFRKGRVLSSIDRSQEAIANFSKALGLARPGDKREIYRAISSCYEKLGMEEKAREYSRKALRR